MKKFLLAVMLLTSTASVAEENAKLTPLEYQEQMDNTKKTLNLLNQAKVLLNAQVMETESQCMKATGGADFCKCISWKTPGDFVQYVAIISKTKEELDYENLPPGDKTLVDNIRIARESCVK